MHRGACLKGGSGLQNHFWTHCLHKPHNLCCLRRIFKPGSLYLHYGRIKGSMRVDFAEEQTNLYFDCYDCPRKQMDCLRVTPCKRQMIKKLFNLSVATHQAEAEGCNSCGSVKKARKRFF